MTINEFLAKMQDDLKQEYKHLHFYLQSSFVLYGPERLHVGKFLEEQANSELSHVRQFANKLRAFGQIPTTEYLNPFTATVQPTGWAEILSAALSLEQEVVANYHERLAQIEDIHSKTNKYMDLVLFYEDQIEHSQEDIDEIVKLLGATRT